MKKILGLFLLTLLIIIIAVVIKQKIDTHQKHYKESCTKDADCGDGKKCIFDQDLRKNVCVPLDNKMCGIIPSDNLYACDPNNTDNGFFNCDNCANSLPWSCRKVVWGDVTVKQKGTKYTVGIANGKGDTSSVGTGMKFNITEVDSVGGIVKINITDPGENFKPGDNVLIFQNTESKDGVVTLDLKFNPYVWESDTGSIIIPETQNGWCLPDIKPQSSTCNIFTSNTVLQKNGDDSYSWSCQCRNPAMFDHKGVAGTSCDYNKTCSKKGTLYVPFVDQTKQQTTPCAKNTDCGSGQLCCTPGWPNGTVGTCLSNTEVANDSGNICHIPWDNQQNSDPREGICDCNKGYTFTDYVVSPDNYKKLCVTDTCADGGGTLDPSGICDCNLPYLSCGGPKATVPVAAKCNEPICIKDICWPYAYYDTTSGNCKCVTKDMETTLNKSITNPALHYKYHDHCVIVPSNNWANSTSKILCDTGNPCEGLPGAQCEVLSQGGQSTGVSYKFEVCTNCPCPSCNAPFCDISTHTDKDSCTNAGGIWHDKLPYANPNCTGGSGPYCTATDPTRGQINEKCGDGTKISDKTGCCGNLKCEASCLGGIGPTGMPWYYNCCS